MLQKSVYIQFGMGSSSRFRGCFWRGALCSHVENHMRLSSTQGTLGFRGMNPTAMDYPRGSRSDNLLHLKGNSPFPRTWIEAMQIAIQIKKKCLTS